MAHYTDRRHHEARFDGFPRGFRRHKGTRPAVKGKVYIELVQITDEGFAIGPRRRADLIAADEWSNGSVAGWRLAPEIVERERVPDLIAEHMRQSAAAAAARTAPEPPGAAEA